MPDFTIVTMEMCSDMDTHSFSVGGYIQTGMFSEQHYPTCTCQAYKYGKRVIFFGGRYYPATCKHIRQIQTEMCTWHEQWGISQIIPGICPECGKETVVVYVAV